MAVEIAPIKVVGLKDALKELNTIDKKLRRQVTRDFKEIMQPVLQDAYNRLPAEAPLSGMARSWKGNSGAELMNWQPDGTQKLESVYLGQKDTRHRAWLQAECWRVRYSLGWASSDHV